MPFLRAARKDEIPVGTIREFAIEGKAVALSNIDGHFYAIDNTCLHRGGPLGEGQLSGKIVTCPWHGWQYDATNGKLLMNPTIGVQCYPVEVRGDDIYVDIVLS